MAPVFHTRGRHLFWTRRVKSEFRIRNETMEDSQSKGPITDEERHELALKLDRDLEEFINSREKKPYTEGWKESNWEQEMEQHPFFMTKVPEEDEPLPPLLEAFQQLKYDPEENTADELAQNYKEDGNFNFKMKKYRFAVSNYSEALKLKLTNTEMKATLHLNRAAAHFHLGNFRSSLNDSLAAAKLKPDYMKAIIRAAQCCLQLKRYSDGLQWCDYGLKLNSGEKKLIELRTDLLKNQKMEARDKRKADQEEKKAQARENAILEAVKSRSISILHRSGKKSVFDLSSLEPCHPAAVGKRVHLDENGKLIWPVIFLYPEYGETDFIQEFHEDSTFADHICLMFEEPPVWDTEKKYVPNRLKIYYENTEKVQLFGVNPEKTLRDVLSQSTYQVRAGTPGFIILVDGSQAQKQFLENYQS